MNKFLILSICLLVFGCSDKRNKDSDEHHVDHSNHSKNIEAGTPGKQVKSPHTATMANIGENHIHIDYSSPRVRGRQIFGGLVAYGKVWSTGAHMATSISFSQDVTIGEKVVSAGKYGLFTIPGEEEWTVILNKNWNQHLADDYNPEDDILRLNVIPIMQEKSFEELTFEVLPKNGNSGTIRFQWNKTAFEFSISNK